MQNPLSVAKTGRNNEAEEAAAPGEEFSLLELRDRVVIMMSFKQLVSIEKIEHAWRQWKEGGEIASADTLWRVLAKDPDLNKDEIYACAAEVYAFDEGKIGPETYNFVLSQNSLNLLFCIANRILF